MKLIPSRALPVPAQRELLQKSAQQAQQAKADFAKHAIAPFCLTTDTVTLSISSGSTTQSVLATGQANAARLRSTYRAPMIVEEIRFNVRAISGGVGTAYRDFRWNIRSRLKVGHKPMTNGFVPIWNFGFNTQPFGVTSSGGANFSLPEGSTNEVTPPELANILGVTSASNYINMCSTRWRLPRPLYVPANVAFAADFTRIGDGFTGDAAIDMGVSGYYVDPKMAPPAFSDIPYVTAWAGTRAASTTLAQRTGELDLFNDLDKPLHIQRVIGRYLDANTRGDTYYLSASTGAQLRMLSKSRNEHKSMVPFFTPFHQVFNPHRLMFNTPGYVLDPKDGVDAEVRSMVTDEAPFISLVGWREESV